MEVSAYTDTALASLPNNSRKRKGWRFPHREGAMSTDLTVISYNCACKMDRKAYFPTNLNAYECFDAQGCYFLASPESLPF